MYLLDTNVLSALMLHGRSPRVVRWVSGQPPARLFTAAICQGEILSGIAILPEGRRRAALAAAARAMFLEDFDGRVLPFDNDAAAAYADIFAGRRRAGRSTATADVMIAAVARCRGATMVTRNVADFEAAGVAVIDPWNV